MSAKRITAYKSFCTLFGIDPEDSTGCANAQPFTSESSSYYPNYWFVKSDSYKNTCDLTNQLSGYSLFATRDYMRCVCDYFGEDVTDCLTEVPDPATGAAVTNFVSSLALAVPILLASLF